MRQRFLRILTIFLIALFFSYYGGITISYHIHEMPRLISHSHPYKAEQSHSQVEFGTVRLSSIILFTAYSAFLLSFIRRIFHSPKNIVCVHLKSLATDLLRAPPSYCLNF
jgi:hypothetical protein